MDTNQFIYMSQTILVFFDLIQFKNNLKKL
jgi:hypothetical protein